MIKDEAKISKTPATDKNPFRYVQQGGGENKNAN
jgi:hypothetical protein